MDTQEKVTRVRLVLDRDYQFVATYPDRPSAGAIRLDEEPPLGNGLGPNPAALLATAVGNCLAASLLFCARRAHVPIEALGVTAEAHLVRNDAGRYRVRRIDVELAPALPAENMARLERCRQIFEDFCIVTESVRHGIDVRVAVAPEPVAAHLAS